MRRLLLVRHAATSATRAAAFPADEPIEPGAETLAAGVAGLVGSAATQILASPALRCAQTAAAAGLSPQVEPRIAESDFGAWAGRPLAEVHADDPAAVAAWMGDPDAAPHDGESLRAFAARVGGWLDEQAAGDGATLAITHGGVVKAALVHALGAPLDAFWRLDVAPLTVTELHAHDGRWTVSRTNCPLEQAGRRPGVASGTGEAHEPAGAAAAASGAARVPGEAHEPAGAAAAASGVARA
ncbi:histidine phosphatase family protein [Conexibacter sp. CPCC 206217]|uniref:histidine phosphatase family protein n=1 Tax=Conexibacter sp. CPCC 206217 TaxID=3064574 RepID=UPI0027158A7A|nr:histidine phosphatase family protein [Conexibacter sp. CPCC 206217]MDO8213637.1 histidine phosphatase family protein [Conexibacter sp. CPCC 206217]